MKQVAVVTRNLMDGSKVEAAVPGAKTARSLASPALAEADLILLDLESGIEPADVVAIGKPVIAYGPHVDVDSLESAVAAGCQQALPRSQIFARLPELTA